MQRGEPHRVTGISEETAPPGTPVIHAQIRHRGKIPSSHSPPSGKPGIPIDAAAGSISAANCANSSLKL